MPKSMSLEFVNQGSTTRPSSTAEPPERSGTRAKPFLTLPRRTHNFPPRTTNYYQVVCAEVFNLLKDDVGLQENPFSSILKLDMNKETREAFSPDELKTIFDNLDGFTRPLFMMAVWTGLREGDICTLKWSDVDLERHLISRKTRKTGAKVQIPISDQLYDMLIAMPRTESEYVFPKHAEMYLANPSGVSYRVKQFLEGLGIETTRIPEGRTRAISVKDLHSCRHTFCYYAGRAAAIAFVPIPLVDVVPLIANETYMIYRLAEVYGIPVDDTVITMILGCAGGSIAGKLAASLLPFLKIPIAAGITYGIGKAAKAYFESDMMLDKAELRETFLKEEREAKKREWKPVEDEDNSGDDDEISDDVHEPADELPEDCRVD